jgi:hypothetical protein
MTRGDDRSFPLTVTDAAGAAVNVTEASLRFTAALSYGGVAVFEKTSDDGIEAGEGTGAIAVSVSHSDTAALPPSVVDLLWEVEVTDDDGLVGTNTRGILRVTPDLGSAAGS